MSKDEVMMMVVVVLMVSFICSFNKEKCDCLKLLGIRIFFTSYRALSGAFRPLLRSLIICITHLSILHISLEFQVSIHQCALIGRRQGFCFNFTFNLRCCCSVHVFCSTVLLQYCYSRIAFPFSDFVICRYQFYILRGSCSTIKRVQISELFTTKCAVEQAKSCLNLR